MPFLALLPFIRLAMPTRIRVLLSAVCGSALLAACAPDSSTAPNPELPRRASASVTGQVASGCSNCVVGPLTYTRTTAKPVTSLTTFAGNAGTKYILDVDDGGSQGARATVTVNGRVVYDTSGHVQLAMRLAASNTLAVRLMGKPGSTLTITVQAIDEGVILAERSDGTLVLIRADGSGITSAPSGLYHADLSTDGKRLVYTRANTQTIWTSNVDGSGEVAINSYWAPQYVPRWSRDNGKIAWTREVSWGGNSREVFTMNADGSNVRQLTSNGVMDHEAQWTPDASLLVFMSLRGGAADIYTMQPDGSNVTPLTSGGWNADPEFSPDGQLIIFSGTMPSPGVYVMNRDGTGRRALVTDPCFNFGESGAHFSPDGQRVAFVACFGNPRRDVYTVRLDGTGLTRLTDTPNIDEFVRSWR